MRDFVCYQEGTANTEVTECQCSAHCRCVLSQNISQNTGKFAECFALTGGISEGWWWCWEQKFFVPALSTFEENEPPKLSREGKSTQR